MKLSASYLFSAEKIGTLVVVLSLVFVGVEIRDGNREVRAATFQSALDTEITMQQMFIEYAATWDKVVTEAPLESGEEMRRGIGLYNLLMTESENRYFQFNSGYLEAQSWEGRVNSLRPFVAMPMFEIWKGTAGGMNHSEDFLGFLDRLADGVPVE